MEHRAERRAIVELVRLGNDELFAADGLTPHDITRLRERLAAWPMEQSPRRPRPAPSGRGTGETCDTTRSRDRQATEPRW
jgi:hypothetical protein